MTRTAVLVDLSSLYYGVTQKYGRRKINYKAVMDYIKGLGGSVDVQLAYGVQNNNEADSFIARLVQLGFTTKYKTPRAIGGKFWYRECWMVAMACDAMELTEKVDRYIILSSEYGIADLAVYLMEKKKEIIVLSINIPDDIKKLVSRCIEIPESMLEANQPKVKGQPEVPADLKEATA